MEIADLVQDNRVVNDTRLVYLVQLFDGVVLFEVEAEDAVHCFAQGRYATNQQYFLRRYFHRLKPPQRTRNPQFHLLQSLLPQMQPLDRIQSAIILMIPTEHKNLISAKKARGCLRPRLIQAILNFPRRARHLRIKPFIFANIIVLARSQLALIISIIAAKSIDYVIVIHRGKERLLTRHRCQNFYGLLIVHQIRIFISICSEDVDAFIVNIIDNGLVWGERIPISAGRFPEIRIPILGRLQNFSVATIALVLMVCFYLLLINPNNIQVHFPDPAASVFKPVNIQKLIHIQTILFGITFEQFSLCYYIVLSLLLFFFIYEVSSFACLVARLRKIRRHSNKILIIL